MTSEQPGSPPLTADLFLLTWVAGVMDGLIYLRARVFSANMTGNTVLLGLGAAGADRSSLPDCALALGGFALGAFLAAIILVRLAQPDERRDLQLGMILEAPFAIAFTALWAVSPSAGPAWTVPAMILTTACAPGIQSVAVRRLHVSGVVTTFITGTITTAIVSFLERREPGARRQQEARTSPSALAAMFLLYIVAAASGAALGLAGSPLAGLDALAALLAVAVRTFAARPPASPGLG